MTQTPALQMTDVTLEYPDGRDGTLRALDDVDFTAEVGTITSLVGPSGSGKSSLLAVAATLLTPTSGSVRINGREVTELTEKHRAGLRRDEVGLIFQQPNLLPSLTALEQLVIVDDLRGKPRRRARERGAEILDHVGLAESCSRRPHELSGGQRQRVNIARALMSEPSVLLVDEPTAALDHERSEEVVTLLCRITRERGTATVMVTHDTDFVPLTDAMVTMRDGVLSASAHRGSPDAGSTRRSDRPGSSPG
ncbi:ABC transporter ATP-binding protein [Nesterenkonia aerolata]|uniref:ABC transporter ATP-binding protein n=1 Tax=Nesterenkonia aerolata TaxID=3074079 RepID=A0ABU2DRE5_9MICC|nr:ABC transporter ATP-binding protein [Nesterenkonia sp. LY-0111]MDR8018971.1 ABC transporter ATP-binding protein [Nesterenkonia sp. LY-0111]